MSSLWMDRIYIQLHRAGLNYCGDSVPIGCLFNMPRGCFREVRAEYMEESSLASLLNLELKSHIWATHSHSVPRDDSLNVAYKDFCYRVVCCCSPCFKCHSSSSFIAFFPTLLLASENWLKGFQALICSSLHLRRLSVSGGSGSTSEIATQLSVRPLISRSYSPSWL